MQTIEMNRRAAGLLKTWDPFQRVEGAHDEEIARIIAELSQFDHPTELAKQIRAVYEQSYEVWIPLEKCVEISYKLLAVKYEAKCIV